MTTRGQSETIGVILLTAVIVITVSAAGAVVLADADGTETTRTDLSVDIVDEGISVAHNGGESVPFDDLRVVVQHGNETWRPAVNASGMVGGGDDGQLDSGDRWVWRQSLDTAEVTTVQVFDRRTNTLLAEDRRYPTAKSSLTPTSEPAVSDAGTSTSTPEPTATATETATATPEPGPEITGVRLSDNSENTDAKYELTYTVEGEVKNVTVFFGSKQNSYANETIQAESAATDPRGTVDHSSGGTMGDDFVIEVRVYAPDGSIADTRQLTDVADGEDPGEGDIGDPDSPTFAGTAVHDLSADGARYQVDYNVSNRSKYQEVRVRMKNPYGGTTTKTSTSPRGSVTFDPGNRDLEYELTIQLVDDSGIVVEERTVTDTADGENPAGNDDLARPDSPDLTKRAVIDRTDQSGARYDAQYRTANWTEGSRVEVVFENLDDPGASSRNSSSQPNGSLDSSRIGGADNEVYAIHYLVYDDDGVLVDRAVVEDTADGTNPSDNDDMAGPNSPKFSGTVISDLSSYQADYELFYNVTNRSAFDHVEVEIENLDNNWASETYTSGSVRDGITAYREAEKGGTYGDEYRITLKVVDEDGIVTDERVVNDTADFEDPTGNADLSQAGSPKIDTAGVSDKSNNGKGTRYRIDYTVTNASQFGSIEGVFRDYDAPYQSGSVSSTAADGRLEYSSSGYENRYVIRLRVYDAEGVLVDERRIPATGTDTADGNDP